MTMASRAVKPLGNWSFLIQGGILTPLLWLGFSQAGRAQANLTVIPGPVSPVYAPGDKQGDYINTGWFPDAHFPLVWGGANEPDVNMSWWIPRFTCSSMDDTEDTPGGSWIPSGAWGSGDYRGYWLTSVIRPSDYKPSLLGTSVNLTIYTTDNSSSATETHVIDANYLVGFAHTEDYDSNGNVTNHTRTLYSYNNGVSWKKGPWDTTFLVAVDDRTTPGSPRLISISQNNLRTTTDLARGVGWTNTPAVFNPGNFAFSNSLFYNRYLGKWMLWYGKWGSTSNDVWTAVSTDLINWELGTQPISMNLATPGGVTSGPGNYPTMLGSFPLNVNGKNYDTESGQLAWLYNNIGGLGGRAIQFIREPRQEITWTGSGGNMSLATTGNWSLAGGGTFGGFVDEKQGLVFSGGSGTLTNNLPATVRVRDLVFNAGAGIFSIGGSTLQLEASQLNWNLLSLRNLSANTQTINAGINARSAALYIHAANAPFVLNGDIDMLGNGGIVVYGAADTTINGVIGNSGYRDFTTGVEEFIADANAGRLVKQDAGTLILGGANTFAGRTDIRGGTLRTTNANALQNSVVSFDANNALVLGVSTKLGGLNGVGNLALGTYNLTLGNNNPLNCYPVRHSGIISGTGSVTKTGEGTQRIGTSNTYSGGTNLNGGILEIPGSVNTALGTGTLSFNGGKLKTLGGVSLNNGVVLGTGGGTIDTNGNNVTLSGTVSGSGQLRTQGTGTLSLSGANNYSGGTIITNTVQVSSNGGLGTGTFQLQGGTLRISNNVSLGTQGISIAASGSSLDTGSFTLTSSGAITVPAGQVFLKSGTGTLLWSGTGSAFDGDFVIEEGTVTYTRNGTNNFTDGSVTLRGSRLYLQPTGTSGNVVVNLVGTLGKKLNIDGAGFLDLNRGGNNSLTVNIGNSTNGNALNKIGTSTFLMSPASGTAALGVSPGVKVFAYGTANTAAGEIVTPSVLATSGVDRQADFVVYNSTTGFKTFTGYTSRSGTFAQTSGTTAEVANITGAATLSDNSYAKALRISGANPLNLNGKTYTINGQGGESGVILNGGTLSGGTLSFGANRGLIYTSSTTASSVGSVISGSGGITFIGNPGTVINLSGTNTYSGGTAITGTKVTGGWIGSANSSIILDGKGTVSFSGTSISTPKSFAIGSGGGSFETLASNYLTLTSPVLGTGDWRKQGTGTLQLDGNNTFSGAVYLNEGKVAFNGRNTLYGAPGTINVASGASLIIWGWGGTSAPIANSYVINGTGASGSAAMDVNGGPDLSGSVTLLGNSLIKGSSVNFKGSIFGTGANLELNGTTSGSPIQISGGMGLGTGTLTISGAGGVMLNSGAVASHQGATLVSAGSYLTVKGKVSGTSGVTVNGILAGTGSVASPGTISVSSGGIVLAGTWNTTSIFTLNGTVNFNAGSEYQASVNSASASAGGGSAGYGQLVVLGTANLDGTLRITRNSAFNPQPGQQLYVLLRNAGSGNFSQVVVVDGTTSNTYSGAPGSLITVGGAQGTLTYNAQSSQALTSGAKDVLIQF